jgi:hypothetical protein
MARQYLLSVLPAGADVRQHLFIGNKGHFSQGTTHDFHFFVDSANKFYGARYDMLLTKRTIKTTQPNFQPCTHTGCNSGQIHETGHDQPIMTCTSCYKLTCFTHKRPWHTGMTCTDFDSSARLAADQEVQTLKTIGSTTKKCPCCEVRIQKNNGCDH